MGNHGCREDSLLDKVQKNPWTSVPRISLRTSVGTDTGLGNFACWELLSMSLQKSTKYYAWRSCQPHTILWLAAAMATIMAHCLFVDGAHCVCDGFKSTRNFHSWKYQNWHEVQNNFSFQIFGRYIVCSARKLPTWTIFKRSLLKGFSKKWSTTLFRGYAFCNKSTNADMTGFSVICTLLGLYTT